MYHSKRLRKPPKVVWDHSTSLHACITTDSQLFSNQANLAGMDKDELQEIDLIKAADAQVSNQLHEIKTPQVIFNETQHPKKEVYQRKKQQSLSALTRYDVLANMYAPDKDDFEFCKKEKINPFFVSWYFTNASRKANDDFFTPSALCFVGLDPETCEKIGQQYDKKVKVFNKEFGYQISDLAPSVARFKHVHNIPSSYACFFPRPPKVATRRKSQMESKIIEATFQIRQEVADLHATAAFLIPKQLEDMRCAQEFSDEGKKQDSRMKHRTDSDEPTFKRIKEDYTIPDTLLPKVRELALFLQEAKLFAEPEQRPLVTEEVVEVARKQAAIIKVRSLFPERRPTNEFLTLYQNRTKEKEKATMYSNIPTFIPNNEMVQLVDFKDFNEVDDDEDCIEAIPAVPMF